MFELYVKFIWVTLSVGEAGLFALLSMMGLTAHLLTVLQSSVCMPASYPIMTQTPSMDVGTLQRLTYVT